MIALCIRGRRVVMPRDWLCGRSSREVIVFAAIVQWQPPANLDGVANEPTDAINRRAPSGVCQ